MPEEEKEIGQMTMTTSTLDSIPYKTPKIIQFDDDINRYYQYWEVLLYKQNKEDMSRVNFEICMGDLETGGQAITVKNGFKLSFDDSAVSYTESWRQPNYDYSTSVVRTTSDSNTNLGELKDILYNGQSPVVLSILLHPRCDQEPIGNTTGNGTTQFDEWTGLYLYVNKRIVCGDNDNSPFIMKIPNTAFSNFSIALNYTEDCPYQFQWNFHNNEFIYPELAMQCYEDIGIDYLEEISSKWYIQNDLFIANILYAYNTGNYQWAEVNNKYMLQHTECLPNARITPDDNNDINIEYIVKSRTGTTKRSYIFLGTLNNYNMLHTNILKLDEGSTWYEDDTDIFNQDATWSVEDTFYIFKDGILLVTPLGTNTDTIYCYNIVDSKVVSVETADNISNSGTDYSLTRYRLKFTEDDHNIYCVKGTSTTREFGLITTGNNLYPLGSMSAYDNLKATNFKNMVLLLAPGDPNVSYDYEILNLKSQGMVNVTWPDWGETKKTLYADQKLFLWKFLFPYHRTYDFNYPLLNHPLILPYNLSMENYDWYLEVTIKKPPTNVSSYCILGNGFKFSDNDETPIATFNTGISIRMNNAGGDGFNILNHGYRDSQPSSYTIYEGAIPNKDYTTVSIRYDQDTSSKKSDKGHLVDIWIDGSPVDYTPPSNTPSTWNDNIGCFECILVHSTNVENNHVYTDNEDLGQIEINFGPNWKYPDLAQGLLDKDEDIIDDTKVDYTLTIQGSNSRVQISKDMPTSLPNTTVTFKVRVSATYTEGGEVANIGTSYFLDESGDLVNPIAPPPYNYYNISFNKNQTDDTYLAFDITYTSNSSDMFGPTDDWTFPKTLSNQDIGDITLTDKYNNKITLEVRADYTFTGLDYQMTSFEITGTNTFSGDAGKAIPISTTGKAYFTDITPFLNGYDPYSTTFLSMNGYGSGFTVTSINVTSVSNDDNSVSFTLSASYTNSNSGTFYINSNLKSIDKWGGSKSCHEDRIITINIKEKPQIQYIKQNVFKNHNFLLKDISGGGAVNANIVYVEELWTTRDDTELFCNSKGEWNYCPVDRIKIPSPLKFTLKDGTEVSPDKNPEIFNATNSRGEFDITISSPDYGGEGQCLVDRLGDGLLYIIVTPVQKYKYSYPTDLAITAKLKDDNDYVFENGTKIYRWEGSITSAAPKKIFTITGKIGDYSKQTGMADPAFTYSYEKDKNSPCYYDGSEPSFTGQLSRDPGETADTYTIHQGTLELANNGLFQADYYNMNFVPGQLTIIPGQPPVGGDGFYILNAYYQPQTFTVNIGSRPEINTKLIIEVDNIDCFKGYDGLVDDRVTIRGVGVGENKGCIIQLSNFTTSGSSLIADMSLIYSKYVYDATTLKISIVYTVTNKYGTEQQVDLYSDKSLVINVV